MLVSNTRNRLQTEQIDGIRIIKVPQLGRLASAPINPTLHLWLQKLGQKADILHFHLPNPTSVMAFLGCRGLNGKVITTYHSDIVRQKLLGKFFAPFLHLFLKKADTIIATSPNYIKLSKVLSALQDKCEVIPLGIDTARFDMASTDAEMPNILKNRFGKAVILFIGRFRYYKGLPILIDAMQKVDANLLLIGAGPLENQLRRRVAEKNLRDRIHFMGELSDEQVNMFLKGCDIFVLPSIYKSEAFGIVQLEAMACGKPVVCCELGTGTSWVNQHQKTGLVVPPENPEALSESINFLLADQGIRTAFGTAGRQRVHNFFTSEKMVRDTIKVYRNGNPNWADGQ